MNRVRLVMSAVTLTGTIAATVLAIGAKSLFAAIEASADPTVSPTDPAQQMIQAQTQMEQKLGEMQAQEVTSAEQIRQANSEIQLLNDELTQLQLEGQNAQAAIVDAKNKLAYAQNRAAQLRGLIGAIPERESQWQAAIQQANQNIVALQAYIDQYNRQTVASSGAATGSSGGGEDHESDGGDEHEDDDEHEGGDD